MGMMESVSQDTLSKFAIIDMFGGKRVVLDKLTAALHEKLKSVDSQEKIEMAACMNARPEDLNGPFDDFELLRLCYIYFSMSPFMTLGGLDALSESDKKTLETVFKDDNISLDGCVSLRLVRELRQLSLNKG